MPAEILFAPRHTRAGRAQPPSRVQISRTPQLFPARLYMRGVVAGPEYTSIPASSLGDGRSSRSKGAGIATPSRNTGMVQPPRSLTAYEAFECVFLTTLMEGRVWRRSLAKTLLCLSISA